MDEPCDVCGGIGFLDEIIACSQCKIAREHHYCRKYFCGNFSDVWLCEQCKVCEMGGMVSPKSVKEDLPNKTLLSNPSGMVDQENECSTCNSKHAKWEKVVKTGKVKYMSALEAITLSSGTKKYGFPSKNNMHSSYGPSEIVGSMSKMTHIKPKAAPSKSILNVKANHSFKPLGILPTGQGSTQTNPVVQQQVTRTSKDPTAPRKEHVHTTQPIVALTPAVDIKNAIMKEGKVMNKAAGGSTRVMHFPPIISSGKITCGNDCTNLESRNFDADNGALTNILPKVQKYFRGPALDSSWKGSFEIVDTIYRKDLNDGFHAHPPSKVRRKVYEFSKEMPRILQFKMLPCHNVWTDIFQDDFPDEDDIGLYFFSSNSQRSTNYIFLLEFIGTQDLVMRSYMDGVELLVFTSKLLSPISQRWNDNYFLWGIFRRVEKHKAVLCKVNGELPLLVRSSECAQDDDADRDDNVVDMEIDMHAGKDVGKVDMAVSRQSSRRCPGSGEDEANFLSLNKIPAVSRNSNFALQRPLLEVKRELCNDIPPGFEETYRLKVQNCAPKETVRVEKSLLLNEKAISPTKPREDSDLPRHRREHPKGSCSYEGNRSYGSSFPVKRN